MQSVFNTVAQAAQKALDNAEALQAAAKTIAHRVQDKANEVISTRLAPWRR